MKIYLGFDDTDTHESPYGTGKLVRWFQNVMPEGMSCIGVVRQQLLVCDDIPYTSHNSAACMIADLVDLDLLDKIIDIAANHIDRHALTGSDPGLCVAAGSDPSIEKLISFGHRCTREISTQREALQAAEGVHLSGHGGTNDGIIGAAAAVGLTLSGWSGRFIEWGNLRKLPDQMSISALNTVGIHVISMERDAEMPAPKDQVMTNRWVRPRLLGGQPVLPVMPEGDGLWRNFYRKRQRRGHGLKGSKRIT